MEIVCLTINKLASKRVKLKTYKDNDAAAHKQATYVVTALDRLWNESPASNAVKL